jgi:hypothetical protein
MKKKSWKTFLKNKPSSPSLQHYDMRHVHDTLSWAEKNNPLQGKQKKEKKPFFEGVKKQKSRGLEHVIRCNYSRTHHCLRSHSAPFIS